jgi:steroid 5-alpha reductase family enzyme
MNFNLLKTASLLVVALIVLPLTAYFLDTQYPLSETQWNTLGDLFKLMFGAAITCFVIGEITKNCSQVDKLWSVIPAVYVWIVAAASNYEPRVTLMAILATVWAARLTFNFARRGGYSWKFWSGEEDYRWEVLRQNKIFQNKIVWKIFHLLFICLYQMTLILLFTLPIIVAWQGEAKPLGMVDYVLAALMIGLIILETIADQQQWDYQQEKYRRKNAGEKLEGVYAKGFIDTGLWGKMRHPNYFAEQSIWVVFYLFSVWSTGRYLNWSMAGAVLLLLLFQGSADFSEGISSEKYPEYKDYIKRVPRFLPKF